MDDDGQLMMLAGIVLTISFILTSLTLAQVTSLEREAEAQTATPIITEWRFLHDRLASNLRTAIGPETTKATLIDSVLPTVQATFRAVESEKGYDLVIRLAGDAAIYDAWGSEADLISGANYGSKWSSDGSTFFADAIAPDVDHNDGILQYGLPGSGARTHCNDANAVSPCIAGVYLNVRMTDGETTMQESILFGANP